MALAAVSEFGYRGLNVCKEFQGLQLQCRCLRIPCRALSRPFRCHRGFTSAQASAHHEKLQVALDVVQRACLICTSVQSGMQKGQGQLDKVDNTPVTIADFSVQAFVSLELGRLFPGIPFVGEENASQLRAEHEEKLASGDWGKQTIIETVVDVLAPVVSPEVGKLNCDIVLDAIDRGAMSASTATDRQRSYWVLDPIDGTRGFLRGGNALYVVGLALVDDGKPVLGVMGCPNVAIQFNQDRTVIKMASTYFKSEHFKPDEIYQRGLVMAASLGEGCWVQPLAESTSSNSIMLKSEVDNSKAVPDSWFCISDNEVWSKSPLAYALASSHAGKHLKKEKMQVLSLCCGSLCKYFAVALGGVSAFLLQADRSTPLKVWDHASGAICVSEAGGQVVDLEGTALADIIGNSKDVFTVKGGGIFASNKNLHHLLADIRSQTAAVGQ